MHCSLPFPNKSWPLIIAGLLLSACASNPSSDTTDTTIGATETGSEADTDSSSAAGPAIEILNLAPHISTEELQTWTGAAEQEVASRKSNILAVVYPIGEYVREVQVDWHHMGTVRSHRVVLSEEDIETIMAKLREFIETAACIDSRGTEDELAILRSWLDIGFDSRSQVALCPNTRIIMVGTQEGEEAESLEYTWHHELYHAFQQGLRSCDDAHAPGQDSMWVVEAGAGYFGTYVFLKRHNRVDEFRSYILNLAHREIEQHNAELVDPGIAEKGAAALQWMVEKELLTQASILDATMFSGCGWVTDFTDDNPNIQAVKEGYQHIACQSGTCDFSAEAFAD